MRFGAARAVAIHHHTSALHTHWLVSLCTSLGPCPMQLFLLLIACGGGASPQPPPDSSAWRDLGLPPDGGTVLWADAELLTTAHPGDSPGELAALYAAALDAGGHSKTLDTSAPPFVSQRWATPEGSVLDLAVTPRTGGGLTASVTRVPGAAP